MSGVVVNADTHPALVLREIVDAVGNRFAQLFIQKVVNKNFSRFALRVPFPPAVLKSTNELFLFCID